MDDANMCSLFMNSAQHYALYAECSLAWLIRGRLSYSCGGCTVYIHTISRASELGANIYLPSMSCLYSIDLAPLSINAFAHHDARTHAMP